MAIAVTVTETLDQKRLLKVLTAFSRGDFSVRMPEDRTGLAGKICDARNEATDRTDKLAPELDRLSDVVGKAGNIKQRASLSSGDLSKKITVDVKEEILELKNTVAQFSQDHPSSTWQRSLAFRRSCAAGLRSKIGGCPFEVSRFLYPGPCAS